MLLKSLIKFYTKPTIVIVEAIVAKTISKPNTIIFRLLRIRDELEKIAFIVEDWKENGINKTGIIPILLIPFEDKLKKTIIDVDKMIKDASKI